MIVPRTPAQPAATAFATCWSAASQVNTPCVFSMSFQEKGEARPGSADVLGAHERRLGERPGVGALAPCPARHRVGVGGGRLEGARNGFTRTVAPTQPDDKHQYTSRIGLLSLPQRRPQNERRSLALPLVRWTS